MLSGSSNFVILTVLTLVLKGTWHFRQILLTVLVIIWGLRLGMFLLMRILQWGEDRRFDEMRGNIGKLVVFWTLQAMWVWTVSLPVTFVNASHGGRLFQPADVIGWTMWVVRVILAMLRTTSSECNDASYRWVFKTLLPFEKDEKKTVIEHIDKISTSRKCSFILAASDIFNAKISGTFKRESLH